MARAGEHPAIAPKFNAGDCVRVARRYPASGHIRAPFYLRGKTGVVIRYFGLFFDPTALAHGASDAPVCGLYQVIFSYDEVWDTAAPPDGGSVGIVADLYDNWLESP